MLHAAIAQAKSDGAHDLALGTHPDNHAARAFFRTNGFEPIDTGPRLRQKF